MATCATCGEHVGNRPGHPTYCSNACRPATRFVHVKLPVDLLDAVDVECEIATISRNAAVTAGLRLWLNHARMATSRRG
jgi:hypothetical protein